MSDIIDINVGETIEEVTINVVDNVIQVNINKVTGGGGSQNLQEVTDNGNVTTNDIQVENTNYFSIVQPSDVGTENKNTGAYAYIGADGVLGLNNGDIESTLKNTNVVNAVTLEFPDKPTGTYTIATTEDITTPTLQEVTDEGNTTTNDIKVNSLGLYSNAVADYGYLSWEDDLGLSFKNTTTQEVFKVDKNSNSLYFINSDDFKARLDATILTDNRTFLLPDVEGTIALISDIPAAQVNSDWNATSGVAEILNKPTIPTNTSDLTNDGSDGVNPFITALDIPTTGQASTLVREVKNMTGATLTKGTVVYISGANGNKPLVSKAIATTDALSARTFGLLQSNISNNGLGYCVIIGDLSGLDTSAFTEGDQLYLSGVTAGTYTRTRTLAPTHLVYVGKITRSHPTQGQIEVGIQNGYELSEIHDVALSSEANNQALVYESSTDLWKNKTIDKTFVGLGNVDNTSDANKPVSTAQQTALNLKLDASSYNWMLSQAYGLLGSSIKGVNLTCPTFASLTATSLGTGVGRYLSYYLPQAATITGVKFFQPNQGVYTGNNYNGVGLYSYSGGTLTLVASTTNDTEFWKGTSATWITKPFSSTYSASSGVYYLFALYNSSAQTTAPTILFNAYNANNFPTIDFTNSAKLGGTSNSGTTALPTPTVATTSINAATGGSGLILLY
jgi:hypothetical protein